MEQLTVTNCNRPHVGVNILFCKSFEVLQMLSRKFFGNYIFYINLFYSEKNENTMDGEKIYTVRSYTGRLYVL